MNWRVLGLTIGMLIWPVVAFGADVPDVKGKWVEKTHTIVAGSSGHWPTNQGTFEKPGLFEKDLVIEVSGQQERRFWGVTTHSGNGEKTDEPLIGELTGDDNRDFVVVDTDGYFTGRLDDDNDKASFCYAHAGGKPGRAL